MKICRIHIKNLNSLKGDVIIDFTKEPLANAGLFAITGETGAGKTTILDAITLALYGEVHRNKNEAEVMSHGTAEAMAEVEFLAKGKKYRSKWSLHKANKKVSGKIQDAHREVAQQKAGSDDFEIIHTKKREIDSFVEKVTGLDYERFLKSVVLSQGDFAAFLKSTDKERSELLERITGTEIYTQISKAAFEKHREEKNKLKELENTLAAKSILASEEIQEIKERSKGLSKEIKEKGKEKKQLQTQIELLEDFHQTDQILKQLLAQKTSIFEAVESTTSFTAALALHKIAAPFQAQLNSIKKDEHALETHQKELEGILQNLEKGIVFLKEKKEELEKNAAQAKQLEEEISLLEEKEDLIKPIDLEIASLSGKQKVLQASYDEGHLLFEKEEKELNRLLKNREESKSALSKANEFLSKYEGKKEVGIVLAEVTSTKGQMEKVLLELDIFLKEKKALTSQLNQLKQERESLQVSADFKSDAFKDLEEQMDTFAENYSIYTKGGLPLKEDLLHTIQVDLLKLNFSRTKVREAERLNEVYFQKIDDISKLERLLDSRKFQLANTEAELLNYTEQLEDYSNKLVYKEKTYHLHLHEDWREDLISGEPCPVCGSTKHPFLDDPPSPMLEQARKEWHFVQRQVADLKGLYQAAMILSKELSLDVDYYAHLLNEAHEALDGLDGQYLEVSTYFNEPRTEHTKRKWVEKIRTEVIFNTQKLKGLLKKVAAVFPAYKEALLDLHLNNPDLADLGNKVERVLEKTRDIDLEIVRISNEKADFQRQIQALVAPFAISETSLSLICDKLAQLKSELEKADQTKRNLEGETSGLAIQIKGKEGQLETLGLTLAKEKEEIALLHTSLGVLDEKKKAIFPEGNIDRVVSSKKGTLVKANEERKKLQDLVDKANNKLGVLKGQKEEKTSIIKKLKEGLERDGAAFQKDISRAGFEQVAALEIACLAQSRIVQYEQAIKQADEAKIRWEEQHKIAEENHNDLLGKTKDLGDPKALGEQLLNLTSILNEAIKETGSLDEKIKHNQKLEKEAKVLKKAIKDQLAELVRWSILDELIGQADGKKFRIFAQSLTLSKLVALANRHLQVLVYQRYYIKRQTVSPLELDIVDTFHANATRSMKTLSGGESFLVSLSLALGLSDLAGRNTKIESLFIDEGFGTLDSSSLDIAIQTLENLKSSGKTIGIISHVEALKERLTTQIRVKKVGMGRSVIEIQ